MWGGSINFFERFFFFFFWVAGGGGRVQVNQVKKPPDFNEFSKNMDQIMPNGEKNHRNLEKRSQKPPTPPPPLNQPSGTPL